MQRTGRPSYKDLERDTYAQLLTKFFHSPLTLYPFSLYRTALDRSRLTHSLKNLSDRRTRHDINAPILPILARCQDEEGVRSSCWSLFGLASTIPFWSIKYDAMKVCEIHLTPYVVEPTSTMKVLYACPPISSHLRAVVHSRLTT